MVIVHLISKKIRTKFSFIIPNHIYQKKTPNFFKLDMYAYAAPCACMHAQPRKHDIYAAFVMIAMSQYANSISIQAVPLRSGLRSVVTGLSVEKRPYNRPAWIDTSIHRVLNHNYRAAREILTTLRILYYFYRILVFFQNKFIFSAIKHSYLTGVCKKALILFIFTSYYIISALKYNGHRLQQIWYV